MDSYLDKPSECIEKPNQSTIKQNFKSIRNKTVSIQIKCRQDYFVTELSEAKSSKVLFQVTDNLLGNDVSETLPNNIPKTDLPNAF